MKRKMPKFKVEDVTDDEEENLEPVRCSPRLNPVHVLRIPTTAKHPY
jgi:hypothetical protein